MKHQSHATTAPEVVVVGSLNVDLIAQVPHLPSPGETIAATEMLQRFGGKGANQAVAAARQGARVAMIGCLGRDADGAAYRQRLMEEGIFTPGIRTVANTPTGKAFINVDTHGENQIIVVAGANAELSSGAVRGQAALIRAARVLLTQLEVPLPAVLEAMRLANSVGVPVVFNPSPLGPGFPWGRVSLDVVIVNELEARQIFGAVAAKFGTKPTLRRAALARKGVGHLLMTRGARPTFCFTREAVLEVPTLPVKPVDTVGAGDAFAGTFAAHLAAGRDWSEAVAWANAAGALATLKPGAQEAMPTRTTTQRALNHLRRHAHS